MCTYANYIYFVFSASYSPASFSDPSPCCTGILARNGVLDIEVERNTLYRAYPFGCRSFRPFGFLLEPYKKLFLKRVLQSAAKIICQTDQQKKLIAAKYALPLEAIVVIPNGVAEEYFVGKRKSENPIPHLLFVGRLELRKIFRFSLKPFRKCKQMSFWIL